MQKSEREKFIPRIRPNAEIGRDRSQNDLRPIMSVI